MSDLHKMAEELAYKVGCHCISDSDINTVEAALRDAEKRGAEREREMCAQIAERFGPSRPCYHPKPPYIHRWEGEQAASSAIAHLIRKRSDEPAH